jgi:4-hydroxyphenylacetate 3-monooxygenase
MLKSGEEYLADLNDGRSVFIGNEKVERVGEHPAFRSAARTIAAIYDFKRADDQAAELSFCEDNERFSAFYLQARTREDLAYRSHAHSLLAATHAGLMGRSIDYVSSFVTGMSTRAELFGAFAPNIRAYYEHLRRTDAFLAHAVVPPQTSRDPAFYDRPNVAMPSCRVVAETDAGVIVRGMKMLATGAILAHEIWVGNIIPLAPEHIAEAITFAVPCNTPGLSMWSRRSYADDVARDADAPLSARYDETDCVLIFDDVFVPWERVFVHNDPKLARAIYIDTPAHVYGNHQSNVRVQAKLRLMTGLAHRLAQAGNLMDVAVVRENLGRMAGHEAALGGIIQGQIHAAEDWPNGYLGYNRRMMYGAMTWCAEFYARFVAELRTLLGGAAFNLPASISVLEDPQLAAVFHNYWTTPQLTAVERFDLTRSVWDLVGTEFAGRQVQYEQFYAGASMILAGHNFREAPWDDFACAPDRMVRA